MTEGRTHKDRSIRAIFWDFGGVITSSPFEAFNAYEAERGLPRDFIRGVNARNPHDNAWAHLERGDIDLATFCHRFEQEALQLGHRVPGEDVLRLLSGRVRPRMLAALARLRGHFKMACLTNNVRRGHGPGMAVDAERAAQVAEAMGLFDRVLESSKLGVRKPEPRFYQLACEQMSVAPSEVVFLDDLGVNLKPAREMGMHTIKVTAAEQALSELGGVLGMKLE
ncbi:MAG: HAD-IA family hydrolase [Gammaproteobacteria bacterium]|nr:HAD-IA family hydrolase [Gammaproteobacteria bacterium]